MTEEELGKAMLKMRAAEKKQRYDAVPPNFKDDSTVIEALREKGELTRNDLERVTGLSRRQLQTRLKSLCHRDIVASDTKTVPTSPIYRLAE